MKRTFHDLICALAGIGKTRARLWTWGLLCGLLFVAMEATAQTSAATAPQPSQLEALNRRLTHITIVNSPATGFRVTTTDPDGEVLAYGDAALDPDNLPPAFVHLMENYDARIAAQASSTGVRRAAPKKVTYANVPKLMSTTWNQTAPFNNLCPTVDGTRAMTGCVATSLAQVLYYHKQPTAMRGYRTYGYTTNGGQRVNFGLDFAATSFDWAHMRASYNNGAGTAAEREAVAQLMYACGIAAKMHYNATSSSAQGYLAADGVNDMMEGLTATMSEFDEELVVSELRAGRPVIYGGEDANHVGHSFVIDGVNTSGQFHCNMGWGGSGDGFYSASDMGGYAAVRHDMMLIRTGTTKPTYDPLPELSGKYASVRRQPVTQLEEGRWYVLWNTLDAASPCSQGSGRDLNIRQMMPSGEPAEVVAPQMVRLVSLSNGRYALQTGLGDYMASISSTGAAKTTAVKDLTSYEYGSHVPGYFWFKNNSRMLNVSVEGHSVSGGSLSAPTDSVNAGSWQVFAVALSDEVITNPEEVFDPLNFKADCLYTLRNTGYSQGYLVALTADPSTGSGQALQPTLRGVTTDHKNGLYTGARYHEAEDRTQLGTFWRIETDAHHHYLVNCGTEQYLTAPGTQKPYEFTATKTPINIIKAPDGTYRINAGTDLQSYLCAATHLATPAAFWTADDAGSEWTIEEAELSVPPTGVTISTAESTPATVESLSLKVGQTSTLLAGVLPAAATDRALTWSSSNESVVRITADPLTGSEQVLLSAVAEGTATVSVSLANYPAVTTSITVTVGANDDRLYARGEVVENVADLVDGESYIIWSSANAGSGYWQAVRTTQAAYTTHADDAPFTADYIWTIVKNGSSYRLRNLATGLYITQCGDANGEAVGLAEDYPADFSIYRWAGEDTFNMGAFTDRINNFSRWYIHEEGGALTLWKSTAQKDPAHIRFYRLAQDAPDTPATIGTLTEAIARCLRGEGTLDDVSSIVERILGGE